MKFTDRRKLILKGFFGLAYLMPLTSIRASEENYKSQIKTQFENKDELDRFLLARSRIQGFVEQDKLIRTFINAGKITSSKMANFDNIQSWNVVFKRKTDFLEFNQEVLRIYKKHNIIQKLEEMKINLRYWQA
jgi:hypothetical protein